MTITHPLQHTTHTWASMLKIAALFLSLWLVTPYAQATPQALIKNNNCLSCHAGQQTLMGPSWQSIAKKYKDQTTAKNALAESIVKGGVGKWGELAMPSNPHITEAEALSISTWILQQ